MGNIKWTFLLGIPNQLPASSCICCPATVSRDPGVQEHNTTERLTLEGDTSSSCVCVDHTRSTGSGGLSQSGWGLLCPLKSAGRSRKENYNSWEWIQWGGMEDTEMPSVLGKEWVWQSSRNSARQTKWHTCDMGKTKACRLRAVKYRCEIPKQITQLSKTLNMMLLRYSQEPWRGKELYSAMNCQRSYSATELLQIFTCLTDSKHWNTCGRGGTGEELIKAYIVHGQVHIQIHST